jgi:hypothetical protein
MPENPPQFVIAFPQQPTPGTLTVVVPAERIDEMAQLEKDRKSGHFRTLFSGALEKSGRFRGLRPALFRRSIEHRAQGSARRVDHDVAGDDDLMQRTSRRIFSCSGARCTRGRLGQSHESRRRLADNSPSGSSERGSRLGLQNVRPAGGTRELAPRASRPHRGSSRRSSFHRSPGTSPPPRQETGRGGRARNLALGDGQGHFP